MNMVLCTSPSGKMQWFKEGECPKHWKVTDTFPCLPTKTISESIMLANKMLKDQLEAIRA